MRAVRARVGVIRREPGAATRDRSAKEQEQEQEIGRVSAGASEGGGSGEEKTDKRDSARARGQARKNATWIEGSDRAKNGVDEGGCDG